MAGNIPRAFIDELLTRVDIVELIEAHIPLKKTGSNYVARCPFHNEKSPSFSVNRAKQFYYCFGCGASGNAISFLMAFNRLNFIEAVEDLARLVGVPMLSEATEKPNASEHNLAAIYRVLQQVAEFYAQQLHSAANANKARSYLASRGINSESTKQFMLGFADTHWQTVSNRFDKAALQAAGLTVAKENNTYYDRFRDRVMFPIRDKRGRVLGFGARVLDDRTPKYLNSPETSVFQKGKEAYGLYELLNKHSRPMRILVVEGYLDVIALAQNGIDYAVATLGTALSKAHLELLFRYTTEIILCFDSDNAGEQAAWRALDAVFPNLKEGRQVRFMVLPQGHDPDSWVRVAGKTEFELSIAAAQPLSTYFFAQLTKSLDLATPEGRANLINQATPWLEKLPEGVLRALMFAELQTRAGALPTPQRGPQKITQPVSVSKKPANGQRPSTARSVIALLLQHPELLLPQIEQQINTLDWTLVFPGAVLLQRVMRAIIALKTQRFQRVSDVSLNTSAVIELFRTSADYKTVKTLAALPILIPESGIEREFNDGLQRLFKQAQRQLFDTLLLKQEQGEPLTENETLLFKKLTHSIFKT